MCVIDGQTDDGKSRQKGEKKKQQHQAIQKLLLFKCTQNDFNVDRSLLNERANDVEKKKKKVGKK